MALDGVVDAVAATTSTEAVLASSSADTDRVFGEFLRLCQAAGPDRCALAGHGSVADRVDRFLAQLRRLAAVSRIGGPPLGWINAPCASWPTGSVDRYTGPWNATTKNPILVIGTRFDPNTPLTNARRTARRLGNAVLLIHDGYGHLSRRDPSACVVQATGRYLVELTTPAPGTVCPSDRLPFDPDFGQPTS
jgi:pimeloyl-ACP methyl ester carboxylesterase